MGNENSKQNQNDNNSNKSAAEAPPQQQDVLLGDDFKDLIEKAQKTSETPVGVAERQLLFTLEAFSLLDHPNQFIKANNNVMNNNNTKKKSTAEETNINTNTTTTTFSESFKWSVLSMLRSCGTCEKKSTTHCPLQRQALILPPFKLPVSSGSFKLVNPLVDAHSDHIAEPALRFICDDCLNMVHIPKYEAIQAEVRKVAQRTRGFAGGTQYIDLVDGNSVCGKDFFKNCGPDETEPTKGIVHVQHNLTLNQQQLQNDGNNDNDDEICVSGLTLGGSTLEVSLLRKILQNPDLKRLNVTFPTPYKGATSTENVGDLKLILEKNPEKYPALSSIEELKMTGYGGSGVHNSDKEGVFPLKLFPNLQNFTLSGFSLTNKDYQEIIDGLIAVQDSSSKTKPGCRYLQNVILVNQSELLLDTVLNTFGQLPLNLLSCANMRISQIDDSNNKKVEDLPPILVSQLIIWGSPATGAWMSKNLLPRAQFLTMIDISTTKTCIVRFLDGCAAAQLGLLRIVRANNCEGSKDDSPEPNKIITTTTSSSAAASSSNSAFIQNGVRKQISSWHNLVSLSTLQLQKLTLSSSSASSVESSGFQKFATLPALTSINISFSDAIVEERFTSPKVLGSMKSLSTLSINSTSRPQYYGGAAPVPPRRPLNNNNNISSSSSSSSPFANDNQSSFLKLPSLQKLHIHNFPPFKFKFDGAPQLKECTFVGSQNKEMLLDFIQQGTCKNVEHLCFAGGPGNTSMELPLGSCSKLKSVIIQHYHYMSSATLSGLASCVNLTKLDISSLAVSPAINNHFSLDQALSGMKNLEELDLSNSARAIHFTGTISGVDSDTTIVFPKLKKFSKREEENIGRNRVMSSYSGGNNDNKLGNLLAWLAAQPCLEEIDIENSRVNFRQFDAFWNSTCVRETVLYLNLKNVYDIGSTFTSETHAKNVAPKNLRVLKWETSWTGESFREMILNIPNLRMLEIKNLRFEELDESAKKMGVTRSWPYEGFVKVLQDRGVELKDGTGHSFLVARLK